MSLVANHAFSTLASAAASGVPLDLDLTFVAQMVIFSALMLVLKPLLFDPVLNLFEERERRTDGARQEARDMQSKAGELLRQYENELERVHRVAAEERDKVRLETAKLEGEILAEARAVAGKIVEDGRKKIEEQVRAIQFELGRDSERLARDIAARVLGREVR